MNGAANIGWDETIPLDSETVGTGDDRLRSIKTSVRATLDDEHNWPSAGAAGFGYHRYGTARPYFGTQSRVSSSGTDARLMLTSDTSRLFGVGSGGTVLLGDPRMLSMGTHASTLPQRHYWAMEMGGLDSSFTATSPAPLVTFPNSGFSGVPLVILTAGDRFVGGGVYALSADSITPTGFRALALISGGLPTSNITVQWMSIGTRVL